MSIPQSIKQFRPTQFGAVEIRFIGNYYYVYQVSSKWDGAKGRAQKVTGKSIGKITEADGFIPNANGLRLMQQMRSTADVAPTVKNYGAYELLQQLAPELNDKLKQHFPDIFREIRTIALLRLVGSICSDKMIQLLFLDSYMSTLCTDIAVSEASVRKFITLLGSLQEQADAFMRDQVMPANALLFDGTSIFTRSADSLAAKGYNPQHSRGTQARILYVFEKNSHKPVFYRVLQGSIVDKVAFMETVHAAGCKDCVIIADKGFYSKENLAALMNAGLQFILPLRKDTVNVEPAFYENTDDSKWDGVFTYNKRPIWFRKKPSGTKGNFIYTYRDDSRKAELVGQYVEKVEKFYGERTHEPKDVLKKIRMGYFSFCSNLDVSARDIYMNYKERWDIEQCFDYLKNSVSQSASHAHTDEYFRGWAFVNHISLLYYYGLLNALRNTKLDEQYSASDVLKLTKNIYLVDSGDNQGFKLSAIQKRTQRILDTLGIDLLRKN
ncbi:transposase [Treponema phagedenis]|uniref:transposase n=1 Tax=Treponema phagedenis TaxID=162 RepID=UPI0011E88AD0|nr:transposase [Treponema phagedenis]QEJ95568.1 transposase [Treponema phagedenis]QEK00447.1 transposase [Treponema phagedenis]QEK05457.1 transposase [Treponema phagedenis]